MEQALTSVQQKSAHYNQKISVVRDAIMGFLMSLFVGLFAAILLLIITLLISSSANAETQSIDYNQVSRGTLFLNSNLLDDYDESLLLSTNVEIYVDGLVSRTKVTQMFTNQSDECLEGVYVFPLPDNAAIDHMKMYVGDRVIEGQIKEKEQAKKIYQQAKNEGKRASLAQQIRPNVFTTAVANVAPGDIIEIQIEYQQTLQYQEQNGQGNISLRFPMAITPRYSPTDRSTGNTGAESGTLNAVNKTAADEAIGTKYSKKKDTNLTHIKIELDAGFAISSVTSPSHAVDIQHGDSSHVTVSLSHQAVPADRDFEITWFLDSGNQVSTANFSQKYENDFYHLVMVMPPTEGMAGVQPLAREIIYIIDTSGSMSGESIVQAKKALLMALERIRSFDTFNIIQFNTYTYELFDHAKMATEDNLATARKYVAALEIDGGTEMYPALDAALKEQGDRNRIRQVIFMTDGGVTNEQELFTLINRKLGRSRLFTVGIGSAPNSYFMKKAAKFGRGTFTYIARVDEVQEKMQALFSKLESPVLSDIKLRIDSQKSVEFWPQRIPDLYLGEPLVLTFKTNEPAGSIFLSGTRASNLWSAEILLQNEHRNKGLNVVWAKNKIENLMDSEYDGHDKESIKQAIIHTAIKHHIVSKYTSLVAVDVTPARSDYQELKKMQLPNTLPKGMAQGRLAQTATPFQLKLILGVCFIFFAIVFWVVRKIYSSKDLLWNNQTHWVDQ